MEFDFVPGPAIDKIVAQIAATAPEIAARYAKGVCAGRQVTPRRTLVNRRSMYRPVYA